MIRGRLDPHFETGTEGIRWTLIADGKTGYDALSVLRDGDRLTVFADAARQAGVWSGTVQLEYRRRWRACPSDPCGRRDAAASDVNRLRPRAEKAAARRSLGAPARKCLIRRPVPAPSQGGVPAAARTRAYGSGAPPIQDANGLCEFDTKPRDGTIIRVAVRLLVVHDSRHRVVGAMAVLSPDDDSAPPLPRL